MMCDLNVPWPQDNNVEAVKKSLAVLIDLGYTTVALNVVLSGKMPKNYSSPVDPYIQDLQSNFSITILTRVTVVIEDSSQNANISALRVLFDIIAVRPMSEKQLQVCTNLDPDLISLQCSKRLPFFLRHKTVCAAVDKGVRMEICYAAGSATSEARKQVISNAASIIRSSRSRGVIISSEASSCLDLRGPYDVVNMACLWGLDHMRASDAVSKEPRLVLRSAELRKRSYKQTVECIT